MYSYPNPNLIKKGISFLKNLKWGAFLDGTQKTLGVINQAIPIVYQVKPFIGNAKTFFNIANEISKTSSNIETVSESNKNHSPIFYI